MKNILRQRSIRKAKRNIFTFLALFLVVVNIATPIIQTFADDGGESKVTEAYSKYAGKSKDSLEVFGKFNGDYSGSSRENTFKYLFSRILVPQYLNDVRTGVAASKSDKTVINDGFLCNPSSPKNLIGYNCNLPNFSAQLGQSVMRVFNPGGITEGERASAKSTFSWGVPANIPGGSVPVDESKRNSKYTGLELFGYNLRYTSYSGEWDDIIPSTRARLLANFGFMDSVNLTGTSIWNGVSSGWSEWVEGLEWNPTTWLGNISKAFESGTSSSFLTIVDTSDMNIATTHAWVRSGSSVGSSFYNVKVLTDKEVMDATSLRVANRFTQMLMSEVNGSPELAKVVSMESSAVFNYNPNLESEASKKARAKAKKKNEEIAAYNRSVDVHNAKVDRTGKGTKKAHKSKVKVPAKKMVPESEQFAKWKKTDSRVSAGEKVGISCSDTDNYKEFQGCWAEKYTSYRNTEFQASSAVVSKLIEKVKKSLFDSDVYSDTTKAISHYVCTDSKGNAMKESNGEYVYLYTKQNSGSKEYVNPKCSIVRPTIQAGYFGNGYNSDTDDTRHISHYSSGGIFAAIPIFGQMTKGLQNFFMGISRGAAQLLNEMLNLAFSPLMEKLGLTKIISSTISSLKDTIFFPLVVVVVAIASVLMFWDAIRNRNATRFFTSFVTMLLVFFIGVAIFTKTDKFVNSIDTVPAKAEQYVSSLILSQGKQSELCTTNVKDSNSGVRSAQCNVWSALVYQPWLYGQFGTSQENLNSNKMTNTNSKLVGTPTVNLGGGKTVKNWALYQLKLMTSGTLTTADSSKPVGQTDPNLYRLVDLQAGPSNGKGTDSRYLSTWSGESDNRLLIALQSAILGIVMFIVIGGMLLAKIELVFVGSILLLGLPFMLLVGLLPKGRSRLIGYAATLGSIMIKRVLITFMISVILLMLNMTIPDNSNSYTNVFFGSILLLGLFKAYKKEIFELFRIDAKDAFAGEGILAGDPDAFRSAVKNNSPKFIRNSLSMAKQRVTGRVSGQIGGALGGGAAAIQMINAERRKIRQDKRLDKENPLTAQPNPSNRFITSSPKSVLTHVRDRMLEGAAIGEKQGASSFARREDLRLTRKGLDPITISNRIKNRVQSEGSRRITEGDAGLESQIYQEIEQNRKYVDLRQRPLTPKEQLRIRQLASEIIGKVSTQAKSDFSDLGYEMRDKINEIAETEDLRNEEELRGSKLRPFKTRYNRENIFEKEDIVIGTSVDEILIKQPETIGEYNPEQDTNEHEPNVRPSSGNEAIHIPKSDRDSNYIGGDDNSSKQPLPNLDALSEDDKSIQEKIREQLSPNLDSQNTTNSINEENENVVSERLSNDSIEQDKSDTIKVNNPASENEIVEKLVTPLPALNSIENEVSPIENNEMNDGEKKNTPPIEVNNNDETSETNDEVELSKESIVNEVESKDSDSQEVTDDNKQEIKASLPELNIQESKDETSNKVDLSRENNDSKVNNQDLKEKLGIKAVDELKVDSLPNLDELNEELNSKSSSIPEDNTNESIEVSDSEIKASSPIIETITQTSAKTLDEVTNSNKGLPELKDASKEIISLNEKLNPSLEERVNKNINSEKESISDDELPSNDKNEKEILPNLELKGNEDKNHINQNLDKKVDNVKSQMINPVEEKELSNKDNIREELDKRVDDKKTKTVLPNLDSVNSDNHDVKDELNTKTQQSKGNSVLSNLKATNENESNIREELNKKVEIKKQELVLPKIDTVKSNESNIREELNKKVEIKKQELVLPKIDTVKSNESNIREELNKKVEIKKQEQPLPKVEPVKPNESNIREELNKKVEAKKQEPILPKIEPVKSNESKVREELNKKVEIKKQESILPKIEPVKPNESKVREELNKKVEVKKQEQVLPKIEPVKPNENKVREELNKKVETKKQEQPLPKIEPVKPNESKGENSSKNTVENLKSNVNPTENKKEQREENSSRDIKSEVKQQVSKLKVVETEPKSTKQNSSTEEVRTSLDKKIKAKREKELNENGHSKQSTKSESTDIDNDKHSQRRTSLRKRKSISSSSLREKLSNITKPKSQQMRDDILDRNKSRGRGVDRNEKDED